MNDVYKGDEFFGDLGELRDLAMFSLMIDLIFRFGKSQVGLCWFSSRKALVVYFVTPFCCIMILNSVFFVSSACLVWESSKSTAKITTTGK
jgi:hypothetical protein